MAEIKGAPAFTFRHATVLDKYEFGINCTAENLKRHGIDAIRETILSELRRLFEGDGLARNITRLEAYWQASDELEAAMKEHRSQVIEIMSDAQDGVAPTLPPEPVMDFPQDEIAALNLMLAQVNEHSDMLSLMAAQNLRYEVMYPRMLLRMFLVSSTLSAKIQRRGELITPASCEEVLSALHAECKRLGVDSEVATSQLMISALMAFSLTLDEEKNSSAPRSDITSPALSQSKQSSGPQTEAESKSSGPVTSEEGSGSNSSD